MAIARQTAVDVATRLSRHTKLDDVDPAAFRALVRYETSARDTPSGPTRTKTIQADYEREFGRRFRRIKGLVRETIVENDALGLTDETGGPGVPLSPQELDVQESDPGWWKRYVVERRRGTIQASPASSFDFPRDGDKVDAFLDWLQDVEDDELLEVRQRGRSGRVLDRDRWQDVYVRRSYGKGLKYANARLREQGAAVQGIENPASLFNVPIHADTLSLLYTRNFSELRGITDAMDQEISRVLTRGLAEGANARSIASDINDRVDAVGLTRSRTLARTEVVRAHSESTLNRYERELGADAEVTGKAEWVTAGDARVCPICEGLEGTTRSLSEARGMIPIHPNCRCAWLPVVTTGSSNQVSTDGIAS